MCLRRSQIYHIQFLRMSLRTTLCLSGKHSPSPCLYLRIPAYFENIDSKIQNSISMIRIAISLSGVDSIGLQEI
jgi:hypothetical protein